MKTACKRPKGRITLWLPADLHEQIQDRRDKGASITHMGAEAFRDYLERTSREVPNERSEKS